MEIIKVVGMQNVSFTDSNGLLIQGTSFFYLQDKDNVVGQFAGKLFVSNQKVGQLHYLPKVGDQVRVFYNRYGKPEDFELVPVK